MSWRSDLITRLRGDAGLAALLGTRIAWFEAQRSWKQDWPQLVLTEVSVVREHTHGGHDGLDLVRVQFDIWASDGAEAETVETALLAEMEADAVTAGSTRFAYSFLLDRSMTTEDLTDGTRVHRLRMDFQFFHETV